MSRTSTVTAFAPRAGASPVRTVEELIKRHEGLRLYPYVDATGHVSIGYGRNLTAKGISAETAADLFEQDLWEAENQLADALPWTDHLDDVRRAVLLDMTYNLGCRKLLTFRRTLALVKAGRYGEAAEAMVASKWATQVGTRAVRLARMMRLGDWP